ncbi:MAG: hypothetical protein AAF478_06275 [Pseudomonadota bacterium]
MGFIVRGFLITAVLYGLLGLGYGLMMAITQDHGQMPTHAHIMVIGWVSFAIFGMFYKQYEEGVSLGLAKAHFWLAQISLLVLVIALTMVYSGNGAGDPIAAVSAIAYSVSFLVFSVVALKAVRA